MRAAKIDANQNEIVDALRKAGCTVQILSSVGKGCTDLVVGIPFREVGLSLMMEVKDGKKPKSAQKLTPDQVDWHNKWVGSKVVVSSVESAIEAVNDYKIKVSGL